MLPKFLEAEVGVLALVPEVYSCELIRGEEIGVVGGATGVMGAVGRGAESLIVCRERVEARCGRSCGLGPGDGDVELC